MTSASAEDQAHAEDPRVWRGVELGVRIRQLEGEIAEREAAIDPLRADLQSALAEMRALVGAGQSQGDATRAVRSVKPWMNGHVQNPNGLTFTARQGTKTHALADAISKMEVGKELAVAELAAAIGHEPNDIRTIVHRFTEPGILVRADRGRYRVGRSFAVKTAGAADAQSEE